MPAKRSLHFATILAVAAGAIFWMAASHASAQLIMVQIGQIDAAKETAVVAYDPGTNKIFSNNEIGIVEMHDFGDGTNLSLIGSINLTGVFPTTLRVSGVAIDPAGRGFGVATVIPANNDTTLGKLVFFDTDTGALLNELDVGFSPDMVTFNSDGSKIITANEGEPGAVLDPAGSISVVDVGGVSLAEIPTLTNAGNVSTYDFTAANLAPGVSLDGVRVDLANAATPHLDIEPEYVSVLGDQAFVSLQENNAIGVFDLTSNKWTAIHNLGTIEQTIDASDEDGPLIDDRIHGMPQPDGNAAYSVGGTRYFVTAHEGDSRGVHEMRFEKQGIEGWPFIDADILAELGARPEYAGFPQPVDVTDEEFLGRLKISSIDGDTDGDGDIDVPTMFGTRSFSIWDAETGALVYDSGSDFETITLAEVPELFNSKGKPGKVDNRSDDKGPEPESFVLGVIGDETFGFIGLERTGGVMMYDITDPHNVSFVDYLNTYYDTGSISPEGMYFISSDSSPDGGSYLLVAYEKTGSIEVFQVIPEPSSIVLLILGGLTLGVAGLIHRHRRRA